MYLSNMHIHTTHVPAFGGHGKPGIVAPPLSLFALPTNVPLTHDIEPGDGDVLSLPPANGLVHKRARPSQVNLAEAVDSIRSIHTHHTPTRPCSHTLPQGSSCFCFDTHRLVLALAA